LTLGPLEPLGDRLSKGPRMRRPVRALGLLLATSVCLFACSSDSTNPGTLGFSIADSLLVLDPNDATSGYVVLSSGTGTCAALQSGLALVQATQVGNLNYLYILLGALDANNNFIPLTAGSYSILDPSASFSPPGLVANAAAIVTDNACGLVGEVVASSGTASVTPFDTTDGGISGFTYTAVFGGTQVTGTYSLSTCLVPGATPIADAGTCVVCGTTEPDGGTVPDGGACAIP
jgi:hypothetical protein